MVDMRLGDGNGLDVISALKRRRPYARGIILTGYGNIATAVTAVKLGAVDYMSKPADADDVAAALLALDGHKPEPPANLFGEAGAALVMVVSVAFADIVEHEREEDQRQRIELRLGI